ncbi:hypothetical protein HRR83_008185 [Exophiala dermatitidis]|uniref:Uncharacterized protein n=1 Tax=Exophiala dermatitidis TaxID=5970 RepID=A0AAN6EU64_EXODE|nr:hypothetical protein HRR74_007860 [Exophiala dermatitidis]KAJ4513614.1 hypothetical protein HRR73_005772 [Exophiala dermatitidis]KAJ4535540.1 hypothetical protein HRR77_007859 [Exophiala dermatitidis]KAJ4544465.1 hypothetical protein HRR76_002524 [Exophiala dermatitidis]KAJ4553225.1 hypothetical protein HRR79_009747 [Exophiala dermatitidis]
MRRINPVPNKPDCTGPSKARPAPQHSTVQLSPQQGMSRLDGIYLPSRWNGTTDFFLDLSSRQKQSKIPRRHRWSETALEEGFQSMQQLDKPTAAKREPLKKINFVPSAKDGAYMKPWIQVAEASVMEGLVFEGGDDFVEHCPYVLPILVTALMFVYSHQSADAVYLTPFAHL